MGPNGTLDFFQVDFSRVPSSISQDTHPPVRGRTVMICLHIVLAIPSRHFISLVFIIGLIALPLRAGDLPVVFVPGLGGTRLVEKRSDKPDRPVWVAPSLMRPATDDRPAAMEDLRLTREGKDRPDIKISPGEMLLSLKLKVSMELSRFIRLKRTSIRGSPGSSA
jgi:hypothetical protein